MNHFDPNDIETNELIIVKMNRDKWAIARYHTPTDTFSVCSAPVKTFTDAKARLREFEMAQGEPETVLL
jgi:hypothetical protein